MYGRPLVGKDLFGRSGKLVGSGHVYGLCVRP
jgi:hypothetical protein